MLKTVNIGILNVECRSRTKARSMEPSNKLIKKISLLNAMRSTPRPLPFASSFRIPPSHFRIPISVIRSRMPELPEVQTVVNDLNAADLIGIPIIAARVYWPRTIAEPSPEIILPADKRSKIYRNPAKGKIPGF